MSANQKKMKMGVIAGNRGLFPDHLSKSGREEILRALETAGMEMVALDPKESEYGIRAPRRREVSRLRRPR